MDNYELAIVLPGDATAAKKKAVAEKVKKLVTTFKGKVGTMEDWGKKNFAYPVKKNDNGNFLFFPLELEKRNAGQINSKLRLDENIIRFLLIKSEKETTKKKK